MSTKYGTILKALLILTVLFELHDRNSGITLAEFAKAIALDMLLAAEIIVNTFSKCTGTFSVYDTDGRKVGNVSIVKIFIQLHDRPRQRSFRAD